MDSSKKCTKCGGKGERFMSENLHESEGWVPCTTCAGTGNSMTTECFVCKGEGKYYLWEDRDCVEGYKLASKRGMCRFCKGEGHIEDNDKRMPGVRAYIHAMEYAEEIQRRDEKKREEERLNLRVSALGKLTEEEIDALEIDSSKFK